MLVNVTLSDKQRFHYTGFGIDEDFIVTPTSLGAVESYITFMVLDSSEDEIIAQTQLYIDPSLNIDTGGISTSSFDSSFLN